MRITLHTTGGLDEVLPFAALGHALQTHGHSVLICAPEKFREMVMKRNLRMVSCGATFEEFLEAHDKEDGDAFVTKLIGETPVHFVSLRDALREADLLIGGLLPLAAPSMAEQLSLPYIQVITSPVNMERSQFPAAGSPIRSGILSNFERKKQERLWIEKLQAAINRERSFSGLAPIKDLFSYFFESGPQLIAVPPEFMSMQKTGDAMISGFWFADEELTLSGEWQDYFATGDPVVFLDRQLANEALIEGLRKRNFRILLNSESTAANADGLKIFPFPNQIPNGTAVAIHTGLTRMVAAAARAGVPQVIVPELVPQADWAERVKNLGVGVRNSQEADSIANAAHKIIAQSDCRTRADDLSSMIRSRDPYAFVLQMIENLPH